MKFKIIFRWVGVAALLSIVSCDSVFEDDLTDYNIMLFSPVDGAQLENSFVQFAWDSVPEAITYTFQIAKPNFYSDTAVIVADSILSSFSASRILSLGDYEWRVKAENSSSESDFTTYGFSIIDENNISSLTPIIESPLDQTYTNNTTVLLAWESLEFADEYYIKVYDYQNQDVGDLVSSSILTNSTETVTLPAQGSYLFSLRAANELGQFSEEASSIFTIDLQAPSAPILSAPNDGVFNTEEVINFTWSSGVDNASTVIDSIYIYGASSGILLHSDEAQESYELEAEELGSGNYDWSVISFDQAGNFTESGVNLFSIDE